MNPFSYGTIVSGSYFYDRKEETRRIIQTLSGGNNLVLYAPRRFGKTSLVFKAIESLEKQGFLCIYFDFMPVFSLESFVRLFSKALSQKQTNLQTFVRAFASAVKSIRPVLNVGADGKLQFSIDFAGASIDETTIAQLLELPEKLAKPDRRVIVFFDEFQEVEKLDSIRFEFLLRSKIQQQQNVNYLFLGSKTHLLKELFNDKKRAFYQAASQMMISYLPESDTVDFLQERFAGSSISIDAAMCRYLLSVTENIPHYIQLLSAEIWQYMVNSCSVVTKEIIDSCSKQLLSLKSDYYMELFDRQSQSKKQLLHALAISGKNIFSIGYIKRHNLSSLGTLQRAIKGLVADGIVEKVNNEYFISDPFFKLFLGTI